MTNRFLELHGDRWNGDDPAIIGGLGKLDGRTVLMIGQERGSTPEEKAAANNGMAFAEGYRKSLRLMQLAAKFDIPVVTLVDCPNAQSSFEAEHHGIAHALARNLAGMSNLPTPIVSVIIGQGGSGGALALGVADRVLMLEHAIYSVISPEGAAAILYRDAKQAEVVSEGLKLTAHDLHKLGIIDTVVPEPEDGGHLDPAAAADALKAHLIAALVRFPTFPPAPARQPLQEIPEHRTRRHLLARTRPRASPRRLWLPHAAGLPDAQADQAPGRKLPESPPAAKFLKQPRIPLSGFRWPGIFRRRAGIGICAENISGFAPEDGTSTSPDTDRALSALRFPVFSSRTMAAVHADLLADGPGVVPMSPRRCPSPLAGAEMHRNPGNVFAPVPE